MIKNSITIEQLNLACRHYDELRATGMSANMARRELVFLADHYAKERALGISTPYKAKYIKRWSVEARRQGHSITEHRTPQVAFMELDLNPITNRSYGSNRPGWFQRI